MLQLTKESFVQYWFSNLGGYQFVTILYSPPVLYTFLYIKYVM
jgi:hypothetical protein